MWKLCRLVTLFLIIIVCTEPKRPVVVKETKDYVWIKTYPLFSDSVVNQYHKPVTHTGTIIGKRSSKHCRRKVRVRLDSGLEISRRGVQGYYDMKVGDRITVTEVWYPMHEYQINNKPRNR